MYLYVPIVTSVVKVIVIYLSEISGRAVEKTILSLLDTTILTP